LALVAPEVEDKTENMKNNEVIAGHLSPCVQIFIESLLNADLTTDGARGTEDSVDIKKGSRKAKQPEKKARQPLPLTAESEQRARKTCTESVY
jgi:hypothetical protein